MPYQENKSNRLQELKGSDFEIAAHQPDIIGWEIFDAAGYYIGDVEDLIFDNQSLKVRYIVTDLDDLERPGITSSSDSKKDKKVLLPIGLVTLHETDDEVILKEEIAANIVFLPPYEKGMISPAHEVQIRDVLTGNIASNITEVPYEQHPDGFYDHNHFDDNGYRR